MKQFPLTYGHVGKNIAEVKNNLRYPLVEAIKDIIDNTNTVLEKEVQTTGGRWFQTNIAPYIGQDKT